MPRPERSASQDDQRSDCGQSTRSRTNHRELRIRMLLCLELDGRRRLRAIARKKVHCLERASRLYLLPVLNCPSGHRVAVLRHTTFAIYHHPTRDATILKSPPPGVSTRGALGGGSMADNANPKSEFPPTALETNWSIFVPGRTGSVDRLPGNKRRRGESAANRQSFLYRAESKFWQCANGQ